MNWLRAGSPKISCHLCTQRRAGDSFQQARPSAGEPEGDLQMKLLAAFLMFFVATVATTALTSPAGAVAVDASGTTTQGGRNGVDDATHTVRTGGGDPGELDLLLVASVGGPALAIGLLLACRKHWARRRAVLRFRAQLASPDVMNLVQATTGHASPVQWE